ncbi:tyrosine-type recombinase/integrase [Limobrevibacterium gyesilva]|uniref:tyrosine-type recombinase/integrase n=1 Tax=Limobrevibacterium gyesilva TaxID=2991712 RepID=UPI0038D1C1E6
MKCNREFGTDMANTSSEDAGLRTSAGPLFALTATCSVDGGQAIRQASQRTGTSRADRRPPVLNPETGPATARILRARSSALSCPGSMIPRYCGSKKFGPAPGGCRLPCQPKRPAQPGICGASNRCGFRGFAGWSPTPPVGTPRPTDVIPVVGPPPRYPPLRLLILGPWVRIPPSPPAVLSSAFVHLRPPSQTPLSTYWSRGCFLRGLAPWATFPCAPPAWAGVWAGGEDGPMARHWRPERPLETELGRYGYGGGLWLQVRGATRRSWLFRYKLAGRAHAMGLGPAERVSLAQARISAEKWTGVLNEGRDPREVRDAQDEDRQLSADRSTPLKEVSDLVIAKRWSQWRNDKHRAQWKATLATYVHPLIGDKPISRINLDDVVTVLEPIWHTKAETARRVRGRLEAILAHAIAKKRHDGPNPAQWGPLLKQALNATGKSRRVTHFPAMPWKEMPVFMQQLRSTPGISARALELHVLTISRPGALRLAAWREFDLELRRWRIPAHHMKNDEDFDIPLSNAAVALLRERGATGQTPTPWCSPGHVGASPFRTRRLPWSCGGCVVTQRGPRTSPIAIARPAGCPCPTAFEVRSWTGPVTGPSTRREWPRRRSRMRRGMR